MSLLLSLLLPSALCFFNCFLHAIVIAIDIFVDHVSGIGSLVVTFLCCCFMLLLFVVCCLLLLSLFIVVFVVVTVTVTMQSLTKTGIILYVYLPSAFGHGLYQRGPGQAYEGARPCLIGLCGGLLAPLLVVGDDLMKNCRNQQKQQKARSLLALKRGSLRRQMLVYFDCARLLPGTNRNQKAPSGAIEMPSIA